MRSERSKFKGLAPRFETVDYPASSLALASLLTVFTVGYLAILVYNIPTSMNELREKQRELIILRGDILRLDEVLTMSARMAVATGNEVWIKRYNDNEPLLDDILQRTERLVQDDIETTQATLQTDEANRLLVGMERNALEAVKNGEMLRAQRILGQSQYDEQKEIYRVGMLNFLEKIERRFQKSLSQKQLFANVGFIGALVLFVLLGLVWHRTLNLLIRWRNALLATQEILADAYNLMALSLDSVGVGTWRFRPFTRELELSPIAAKALGLRENHSHSWKDLVRPLEGEQRQLLFNSIRAAKARREPVTVELQMPLANFDRPQWLQVVLEAADASGVMSGTISNVTQRRGQFRALESENAKLEKGVAIHLKTVRDQAQLLRSLALEVSEVENRERQRLAMVLHDSLQQDLVGLRFRIASIQRKAASNITSDLQELFEDLDDCIGRVRTLSIDLSPGALRESGLVSALDWLQNSMKSRFDLEIEIDTSAIPEGTRLYENIETLAFQCIRELLFNVVKHSRVLVADVKLALTPSKTLVMSVSDQGVGFELGERLSDAEEYTNFGLRNIASRVRAIGGAIFIETSSGNGTIVELTLPIDHRP